MIQAIKKDAELLLEIKSFEKDDQHFHVWWLGQSGYLILWKGKKILIDPYLSDSLTRKYSDTRKPHVRMSERVIAPELLQNISIVSSSHNHTDHLDAETLIPIINNNPGIHFIIPEANRSFVAERVKMPESFTTGLTEGEKITFGDFTFTGVAAAHNTIDRDEKGRCKYMGYIIQFGNHTLYHSGDTLWFEGMEKILAAYNIDLAFLPINGNDPAREVAGNLNSDEAVNLALKAGIRHIIPCHYDMFVFNTADPQEFAQKAAASQQPYTVLSAGGHWSSKLLR